MTKIKTIRQCLTNLSANGKRPGLTRRLDLGRTLLILTVAAFQLFANRAAALPIVLGSGHHTDRFAPHSIAGWPLGDFVQIAMGLSSTDPPGSPTIVVNAHQGDTTLTLDRYPLPTTIYPTPHVYYKFFDFDSALLGPWKLTPADSTGTGPAVFTNAIAEPEFLPVVQGITVQGTPIGTSVKWTLPNLTGFDVEFAQVRILQVSPLAEVFMSNFFPVHTTSFAAPPGLLHVGVEYAYQVSLEDVEGAYEENRSNALSAPFRFTIRGDLNTDGHVTAADIAAMMSALTDLPAYEATYHVDEELLNSIADVNQDNKVTNADLQALLDKLKSGGGSTDPIPEPPALVLFALTAVGFAAHRKKLRLAQRIP